MIAQMGPYRRKSCNIASESALYSSMKGKMAAESASCGILMVIADAESASCSKILAERKENRQTLLRKGGRGWSDVGPAQAAVAACFVSWKQIWVSVSADSIRH